MNRWRLKLHLEPIVGYMNDPCGLCFYKGYYHIYFQYAPESPLGGLKHWGHYKTKDFVNYIYCGIAIEPDSSMDRDGVYSGCAVVTGDRLHLFYTGNVKLEGDFDYINSGRLSNVIHLESDDGINFSRKRCILDNNNYPVSYSCHVRDPMVYEEDNMYHMLLGGRLMYNKGSVLHYVSTNLSIWNLKEEISSNEAMGYMWECPFVLRFKEDIKLLGICPQGVKRREYIFQNIYSSGYFSEGYLGYKEWDFGFDFYAAAVFNNVDRDLMMAWCGLPDIEGEYENPTVEYGYQHALTLVRRLSYVNNRILTYPSDAYMNLRCDERIYERVKDKLDIEPNNDIFDIQLWDIYDDKLDICFDNDLVISYKDEVITVSFKEESNWGRGRTTRKTILNVLNEMRIIVDTSLIEIYINKGELTFTSRYYSDEPIKNISFKADTYSVGIWKLKPIKIKEE